jgi:addiction module HigA family antidote
MKNAINTHPGEILSEEFLKPMKISQNRLAIEIRVPTHRINEIINGRRSITADTALRLGIFFGTTADFWLNLQSKYDIVLAEEKIKSELSKIQSYKELAIA